MTPQSNTHGHIVRINDMEMYYEEYGTGKPLLLLHGFGGCTQNWHPFTTEFSNHYRLIVVDLRGHGYSTNPDNIFTHKFRFMIRQSLLLQEPYDFLMSQIVSNFSSAKRK